MQEITLGSLCCTPAGQVQLRPDIIIDYIDISSVSNETKSITGYTSIPFSDAPSRARKAIKDKSILVSTVRPNLNAIAVFDKPTPNVPVASTGFCVLDCKENVDYRFIYHYCKSTRFINQMVAQATGASYPAVNDGIVRSALLPNYCFEEQKRISKLLDKTETIIRSRKNELQAFDTLIKARFVEMFGTIDNNPFEFPIVCLQDVCEQIKDGTHQTPEYTDDNMNGFKFLSSKDVTSGKIDWHHLKYIPKALHDELYARIAPRKGDILLAKNGTTGIAAIVDTDDVFDIYVSLALLRPMGVHPVYLWAAINSTETKRQFDASLKGIGVPNLHLGEIKKAKVLMPPKEMQNQFATFVSLVDKSKVVVQAALEKAQLLFDSLMQQYFG